MGCNPGPSAGDWICIKYQGVLPIILKDNPNVLNYDVTGDLAIKVATQNLNKTKDEMMEILRKIYGNDIPEPTNINQNAVFKKCC